jgi:hypothetical protein
MALKNLNIDLYFKIFIGVGNFCVYIKFSEVEK